MHHVEPPSLYGLLAEFLEPEEAVTASRRAYEQGYRCMDAYSPFPVEGLAEATGFRRNYMALIVLIGGLAGGLGGYFMQWYTATIDYPVDIGGRPFNSWPAFIPITFEMTVLIAAFANVLGMLGLNGLPRPYHPIFNVPEFVRGSHTRFYLCIEADDPKFHPGETRRFLEELHPHAIFEVARTGDTRKHSLFPEETGYHAGHH